MTDPGFHVCAATGDSSDDGCLAATFAAALVG